MQRSRAVQLGSLRGISARNMKPARTETPAPRGRDLTSAAPLRLPAAHSRPPSPVAAHQAPRLPPESTLPSRVQGHSPIPVGPCSERATYPCKLSITAHGAGPAENPGKKFPQDVPVSAALHRCRLGKESSSLQRQPGSLAWRLCRAHFKRPTSFGASASHWRPVSTSTADMAMSSTSPRLCAELASTTGEICGGQAQGWRSDI